MTSVLRNISMGSIRGETEVMGIVAHFYNSGSLNIKSNVSLMDTIYSKGSCYRVSDVNPGCNDNYAYIGTVVYANGKEKDVADNCYDGYAYGLKTLKRQSTYEGLGFDFTSQWTIDDGNGFPYNIHQCPPVKVSSFVSGSKAKITGTASVTGTVYVIVGDYLYEAAVIDGTWEVHMGSVSVGTVAYVSVDSDDKLPSVVVKAVSTDLTTEEPEGESGDANGDGVVDAADVVGIVNHLLGNSSSSFNEANADVNADGQVLIDDAVGTVQIIMNQQ